MLRTVHLHGVLAEKFGDSFVFDIDTPAEAGRALACLVPGFASYIADKWLRVVRGDLEDGVDFDRSTLGFRLGSCNQLHIVPMPAGGDDNGIVKTIIGVAFIALSFVFPGFGAAGAVTLFGAEASVTLLVAGAGLALTGIASMLAPSPNNDPNTKDKADERASFIFNGPVNRIEEGGVVPLGYGRLRIGSVLGSGSLQIEKMP
jgi:predicted phage tail protein